MSGIRAEWQRGAIVARGAHLPDLLAVVPAEALALGTGLVGTSGAWERSDGLATFTPRFVAVPGTTFAIVGRESPQHGWRELARIAAPAADLTPHTRVESIDPGTAEIPANLLRFSVTFSQPMEEGSAAGAIHLLDHAGAPVPGALLEMPPELWDRERRRLTILLEPGRIKRGLQPNLLAVAPLRAGGSVTLVVDAAVRDARGAPLVARAEQSYRVVAPVRSRVDPSRWHISRFPAEESDGRIAARFDRPLDRALLRQCLRVTDRHGHPIAGVMTIDRDAQLWVFTAQGNPGGETDVVRNSLDWRLHVDTRLEDLAGNSVRRVFDRDLTDATDDGIDASEIVLGP